MSVVKKGLAFPFFPKILVWQISILPTRALPPALIKQSNNKKKTWIVLIWFYCAFSSFYLVHTQWPFSSKTNQKNISCFKTLKWSVCSNLVHQFGIATVLQNSWTLSNKARTYLQPHYSNGVIGNVYLSARQH